MKILLALLSLAVLAAAQLAATGAGSLALVLTQSPALGNAVAGVLYPALGQERK